MSFRFNRQASAGALTHQDLAQLGPGGGPTARGNRRQPCGAPCCLALGDGSWLSPGFALIMRGRTRKILGKPFCSGGRPKTRAFARPEVIMSLKTEMTGQEMIDLARKHTFFEWSPQGTFDPLPVARAKGVYFWTPEGKRYLDFNSQLMCVNIGHGDERVVRAIQQQAGTLAYANPFMATEARARLGRKLAEVCPGDIDVFFFTNGGAEANENAIKVARMYTGRHKVISFYRSYHGGTAGAIMLTGDPRRWPAEPGMPGVVHVLNPYHGIQRGWDTAEVALARIEETIQLEGPHTIAALFIEPVTGTNGVLVPPDGFIRGIRDLCTRHGILMAVDEVMSGFGRTGEWFSVDHWRVVPDLMT